jgi:hypothetical protein
MTSDWENPFRLVETPDGPVQAGLLPDAGIAALPTERFRTHVLVGEPGEAGGQTIMRIEAEWAPRIGATLQLGEPNRDALVFDVQYRMDQEGLWTFVYVHDPIERVYDPS